MILFYILIALFIALIWVHYFKQIDVFSLENFRHYVYVFLVGGFSVILVFVLSPIVSILPFHENGADILNTLLFFTINVGCVEELSKITAFYLFFMFFKKYVDEPIDYISYVCIAALGFSAVENVMYFSKYGAEVIDGRAILSSVGHMFFTAIFAYGIVRIKFHPDKPQKYTILYWFGLAALSHGIFNTILTVFDGLLAFIGISLFFLVCISFFITILNNSINNSEQFEYSKTVSSRVLTKRLFYGYLIVFILQFIAITIEQDSFEAFIVFLKSIILSGPVIFISIIRISRFKLIKNRWNKFKVELPFYTYNNGSRTSLRIKGIDVQEERLDSFFEQYIYLTELSAKEGAAKQVYRAFITGKVFLKNDETYYVTNVFSDSGIKEILLKPKFTGKRLINNQYPLVSMLFKDHLDFYANPDFESSKFKFLGWASVSPYS